MIRLAGSSVRIYETGTLSHPSPTNIPGTPFDVTHNFGTYPDRTEVYHLNGGDWQQAFDWWYHSGGPGNYGFLITNLNANSIRVTLYIGIGSSVKIKCYKFS